MSSTDPGDPTRSPGEFHLIEPNGTDGTASMLNVTPEVADALAEGRPVVALESTIVTHGMPYPDNLTTAQGVEQVVREAGAVPATIAVLDGELRIGLDDAALERLAGGAGGEGGTGAAEIAKASRRDLPALLAAGASAGTTVAATMFLAHRAGIPIFATGGIGGVHRGAEHTFDVSADLDELGSTPVTVVCAGAKSILDLPKTLETLETYGVPVIGVGTDEFPAFFTRSSGLPVDHRVEGPAELAAVLRQHARLALRGGVLVVNPIPEADALDPAEIDARIAEAIADAEREGISRKEVTPYLLARINELTGGRSLVANIALIRNNARLAALTAVELAR
ncbi:MAG: pseudouridine-5'-phosphate glycosidase [Kineosporiaceae bacterium]